MIRHAGTELIAYIEFLINAMPGGSGYKLRRWYFGLRLKKLGLGAVIGSGLLVSGARNISIGSNFSCWRNCTLAAGDDGIIEIGNRVALNANVYINASLGGRVAIGNDVLIAPNVVLRASDHVTTALDKPIREQGHRSGVIVVEDDVWLAANVTVVGGVCVGRGAVVAAGAVVTKNIDPNTVVGGVPARMIKRRGT
jgi:galactoside O-acetyltransferase